MDEFTICENVIDYCLNVGEQSRLAEVEQLIAGLRLVDYQAQRLRSGQCLELARQLHGQYETLGQCLANAKASKARCKVQLEQLRANLNLFSLLHQHEVNFLTFCNCGNNSLFEHLTSPPKSEIFLKLPGQTQDGKARLSGAHLRAIIRRLAERLSTIEAEHEKLNAITHLISEKIEVIFENLKNIYNCSRSGRSFYLLVDREIDKYFRQANIDRLSNLPLRNRNLLPRSLASAIVFLVIVFYALLGYLVLRFL